MLMLMADRGPIPAQAFARSLELRRGRPLEASPMSRYTFTHAASFVRVAAAIGVVDVGGIEQIRRDSFISGWIPDRHLVQQLTWGGQFPRAVDHKVDGIEFLLRLWAHPEGVSDMSCQLRHIDTTANQSKKVFCFVVGSDSEHRYHPSEKLLVAFEIILGLCEVLNGSLTRNLSALIGARIVYALCVSLCAGLTWCTATALRLALLAC